MLPSNKAELDWRRPSHLFPFALQIIMCVVSVVTQEAYQTVWLFGPLPHSSLPVSPSPLARRWPLLPDNPHTVSCHLLFFPIPQNMVLGGSMQLRWQCALAWLKLLSHLGSWAAPAPVRQKDISRAASRTWNQSHAGVPSEERGQQVGKWKKNVS